MGGKYKLWEKFEGGGAQEVKGEGEADNQGSGRSPGKRQQGEHFSSSGYAQETANYFRVVGVLSDADYSL